MAVAEMSKQAQGIAEKAYCVATFGSREDPNVYQNVPRVKLMQVVEALAKLRDNDIAETFRMLADGRIKALYVKEGGSL